MKNYMKYFLLMGLVSVASAEMLAEDEREGVTNDRTVQPDMFIPVQHPFKKHWK